MSPGRILFLHTSSLTISHYHDTNCNARFGWTFLPFGNHIHSWIRPYLWIHWKESTRDVNSIGSVDFWLHSNLDSMDNFDDHFGMHWYISRTFGYISNFDLVLTHYGLVQSTHRFIPSDFDRPEIFLDFYNYKYSTCSQWSKYQLMKMKYKYANIIFMLPFVR